MCGSRSQVSILEYFFICKFDSRVTKMKLLLTFFLAIFAVVSVVVAHQHTTPIQTAFSTPQSQYSSSLSVTSPSQLCRSASCIKKKHQEVNIDDASTLLAAATSGAVAGSESDLLPSVFNLAKTILGAGILSLPSGIAAFSDSRSSLLVASALLMFMGVMSAYSFSSIGRSCRLHGAKTFSEAWAKTFGPKSAVIISSVITFKTFFACLAYSIIIGDSFSSMLKSFGLPSALTQRSNVIMYIHALIIFPLCLQKNLDALKYTSILGIIGIAYCAVFMTYRLFDGSYLPGGSFFNTLTPALKPSFNKLGARIDSKLFVLISMISTAYVAHYNAPKFWTSLKNKTPKRYNTLVSLGFAFSFIMYMIVMWAGFLTFGGNSTGFILNNYSNKDNLATLARLAIGAGILCGYPLTFTALRDGIFDLMKVSENKRDALTFPLTATVCTILTGCALVLKNVGLVVAFSGALIGAMLIYFVPAIMNIKNMPLHMIISSSVTHGDSNNNNKSVVIAPSSTAQKFELAVNYFMAFMGVAIACVGGYTTLKGASGH